jgi:hypothetical protein
VAKLKIFFYLTIAAGIFCFGGFSFVFASNTNGTIDPIYKYAWSENTGWINFGTTNGDVHVTDSGLSGYALGENIGWINLDNIVNDGEGNLSGYAWGENAGWIKFNPTNGGVTINSSGEFTGYALGENIGWIIFGGDYKVKTDWRPASARTDAVVSVTPIGGFDPGPAFPTPPVTTPTEEPAGGQTTIDSLLAKIKELQDKIAILKQQIQSVSLPLSSVPVWPTSGGQVSNAPLFTEIIKYNDKNQNVINLQTCFKNKYPELYQGSASGWFGPLTLKAVKLFQEKYRDEILTPAGFSKSTGIVGNYTIKKLNGGCK